MSTARSATRPGRCTCRSSSSACRHPPPAPTPSPRPTPRPSATATATPQPSATAPTTPQPSATVTPSAVPSARTIRIAGRLDTAIPERRATSNSDRRRPPRWWPDHDRARADEATGRGHGSAVRPTGLGLGRLDLRSGPGRAGHARAVRSAGLHRGRLSLLVLLILLLQAGGAAIWLPIVRRRVGDFRLGTRRRSAHRG